MFLVIQRPVRVLMDANGDMAYPAVDEDRYIAEAPLSQVTPYLKQRYEGMPENILPAVSAHSQTLCQALDLLHPTAK